MYSEFQQNKLLSEVSTFGIGGPARFFVEVRDAQSMQRILAFCQKEKLAYFILGKGSNCLFDSKGIERLVIHNKIDFCTIDGPHIYAGSGYSFSLLGVQTARKGLSGLEFASGIPASVGGAVFMNAGAGGQSTFDTLQFVDYVEQDGRLLRYSKAEIEHGYRSTQFHKMKGAIVAAGFTLSSEENARTKQLTLLTKRIESQPYEDKSAGCVFKNPESVTAGQLIDKAGLKGFQIGGAMVSALHANFLVNRSHATSEDVLSLIAHVKKRVKEDCGIDLETEIFWIRDHA